MVHRNWNVPFVKSKLQLSHFVRYGLKCNSTLSRTKSQLECSLSLIGVVRFTEYG